MVRKVYTIGLKADQEGIRCPSCGGRISTVNESRAHQGVRLRRRRCRCGHRYTTVEQPIDASIYDVIVKGSAYKVLCDREA